MQYVDNETSTLIGMGSEHIAFSFKNDEIITITHEAMRKFCEDATYAMDERNEPEMEWSLIDTHQSLKPADADFETIVSEIARMRDSDRCPVCDGFGGGSFAQGKGWVECTECGGTGKRRNHD